MKIGKIFNGINTAVTIIGAVYTVTKFMFDTFKKYEKKHGSKNKRSNEGTTGGNIQEGHEILQEIPEG